jgi:hypothetical protein
MVRRAPAEGFRERELREPRCVWRSRRTTADPRSAAHNITRKPNNPSRMLAMAEPVITGKTTVASPRLNRKAERRSRRRA